MVWAFFRPSHLDISSGVLQFRPFHQDVTFLRSEGPLQFEVESSLQSGASVKAVLAVSVIGLAYSSKTFVDSSFK